MSLHDSVHQVRLWSNTQLVSCGSSLWIFLLAIIAPQNLLLKVRKSSSGSLKLLTQCWSMDVGRTAGLESLHCRPEVLGSLDRMVWDNFHLAIAGRSHQMGMFNVFVLRIALMLSLPLFWFQLQLPLGSSPELYQNDSLQGTLSAAHMWSTSHWAFHRTPPCPLCSGHPSARLQGFESHVLSGLLHFRSCVLCLSGCHAICHHSWEHLEVGVSPPHRLVNVLKVSVGQLPSLHLHVRTCFGIESVQTYT